MSSSNSEYLSPASGEASPEFYDANELLEDESVRKGTDGEKAAERCQFTPTSTFPSGFTTRWMWSTDTEICASPQKSELPPPLDDGHSVEPAENSEEVGTSVSLSAWPLQYNTNRVIVGAGMENLGNTCFMNSVLQCFIHTVPILRGILSDGHLLHSNCNNDGFCLLCALGDLTVCSLTNSVVSPHNLADNLSYISSSFKRFQQEDAHEFLQCFLDRLENCDASESKACTFVQSDNIVKQVFGGRVVSNLKCCNCGHCSDTYEPSIDLSLEIEDADNLLIALQSFTKVERIEDPDNKFTCEECKEQVSVEKTISVDQAPSVAVFHLKRFQNDGCFVQKIDKHVSFPLVLDLLPFTGSNEKSEVELKYVLYAVVVHIGLTSTSGHYYCFIRLFPNMWCKFDDSRVELVDEDYVLSQNAYILFYAKESTPWFSNFIESEKEFVHSTTWNTSPKSVLDNLAPSPVSHSLENKYGLNPNEARHGFGSEHSEVDEEETKHSGPIPNKIGTSDSVAQLPSDDIPDVPLSVAQKVSPIVLEKTFHNQEDHELQDCINYIHTPLKSPSPEIYREDPPDAGFSISCGRLKLAERASCKRRLDKDMDGREIKQACSFIRKNMHSSRRLQLLAAIEGPKNEALLNTKKRKIRSA